MCTCQYDGVHFIVCSVEQVQPLLLLTRYHVLHCSSEGPFSCDEGSSCGEGIHSTPRPPLPCFGVSSQSKWEHRNSRPDCHQECSVSSKQLQLVTASTTWFVSAATSSSFYVQGMCKFQCLPSTNQVLRQSEKNSPHSLEYLCSWLLVRSKYTAAGRRDWEVKIGVFNACFDRFVLVGRTILVYASSWFTVSLILRTVLVG